MNEDFIKRYRFSCLANYFELLNKYVQNRNGYVKLYMFVTIGHTGYRTKAIYNYK